MLRLVILAAVVAVPACLSPNDVDSSESTQAFTPVPCPQEDCGNGNSPVMDGVYFWNLSSAGTANDEGVAITSVQRFDGVAMRLVADVDRLRGIHPVTGVALADGIALVDTRITVTVKGAPYRIRIRYVSPTFAVDERFWVGSQARIEAYDFVYTPLFGPERRERPLCSLANDDPFHPMVRAIAFAGDKYNAVTKQITVGLGAQGWMNIACRMGAPYKMHLIGHTTAAATRLGIGTSLRRRHAMLNAWTMNACGTGTTYTEPNTPITLTESLFLLPPASPFQVAPTTSEAIWGSDGAVCLDTHRLATDEEDNALRKEEIAKECGAALPSCDSLVAPWTAHGSVLTGSP